MTQASSAFLDAAGEIIRANWQEPKSIDYKGVIDLVTDTDPPCQRAIVERLARQFPGHSILAEAETRIERQENSCGWIVDPLDGTTNFAHGYPHFCVSIALERNGKIILGLVYDPLRRECFRAIAGQGATLNGQSVRCASVDNLDKALLATGFPFVRWDDADYDSASSKPF